MNADAIFLPMLGLMTLTAVVWFHMYAVRIPAMKRARIDVQTYTTPQKVIEHLPVEASYPANNLKNLLELPVLFYGLCLYLYVTGSVDSFYVFAAWAFLMLRVLHSIVHCTRNIVIVRFYLYASGAVVLWCMLGRALFSAIAVHF
ncbi:MAG: MAPEG family protein [Gammaproteobacteria bacterium]|nr:MAPEG family protein [Gammaproteobacteria bacterium]